MINYINIFLISGSILSYEIFIMRIFSITSWLSFGNMVISIALLGFSLSGIIITIQKELFKKYHKTIKKSTIILYIISILLSFVISQKIPFNPLAILEDKNQILYISLFYILYFFPFFFGATYIGLLFLVERKHISRLYFFDLLGAGIGSLIILIAMYIMHPKWLVSISIIAGIISIFIELLPNKKLQGTILLIFLTLLGYYTISHTKLNISQYKAISYVKLFPDYKKVVNVYSPLGYIEVASSKLIRSAPGLSLSYVGKLPPNLYEIFIDGNSLGYAIKKLPKNKATYIEYLPSTLAYKLVKNPDIFIIGLGGGERVFYGIYYNANKIYVAETNSKLHQLLYTTLARYNNHLLHQKNINIKIIDGRAFAMKTKKKFDIIDISLLSGGGMSFSTNYTLFENYLLTTESIETLFSSLKKGGILQISLTVKNPPRKTLKIISLIISSLYKLGYKNQEIKNMIVAIRNHQVGVILLKKGSFSSSEIKILKRESFKQSFDFIYYPKIEDFVYITKEDLIYRFRNGCYILDTDYLEKETIKYIREEEKKLCNIKHIKIEKTPESAIYNKPQKGMKDFFYLITKKLLKSKESFYKTIQEYPFNIVPPTDDKPYFDTFVMLSTPTKIKKFFHIDIDIPFEEWGYYLLWGTFLQSIIFGIFLVLIPFAFKKLRGIKSGKISVFLYFGAIGTGYMLMEIALIQKLILFLANPIYSTSIVLAFMLIFSGIGSLYSKKLIQNAEKYIKISIIGIILLLIFYIFVVFPSMKYFLFLSDIWRIILAITVIFPIAFIMGFFFPIGIYIFGEIEENLIPWAWGINGATSVIAVLLSKLIAIHFGYKAILITVIIAYLMTYPAIKMLKKYS